jgi:phosphoribosylaminoimidazole-succinocarboxamide synthase
MRAPYAPMVTTLATPPDTVFETDIHSLQRLHKGKVRDVYAIDEHSLLIITTDRL